MRVQNILNSRPRKRLGYMTPKEIFKQLTNLDYNAVVLSAWIQHYLHTIVPHFMYILSENHVEIGVLLGNSIGFVFLHWTERPTTRRRAAKSVRFFSIDWISLFRLDISDYMTTERSISRFLFIRFIDDTGPMQSETIRIAEVRSDVCKDDILPWKEKKISQL